MKFDHADSPLGKKIKYPSQYSSKLLYSIPRESILTKQSNRYYGHDIWNAYELSWLNHKGKPQAALGQFILPCHSPFLIESKSMKLFLNSLNNTTFSNKSQVAEIIKQDLSQACGTDVEVSLSLLDEIENVHLEVFDGKCIDGIDITTSEYSINPTLLRTQDEIVKEALYSNLLKSNCPVTGQPDWGSIRIEYHGKRIDPEALLKYIISYRNHEEFHEHCVERFFLDIINLCKPQQLTIEARYNRRGGLDINPLRSTHSTPSAQQRRLIRQ